MRFVDFEISSFEFRIVYLFFNILERLFFDIVVNF